MICEDNMVIKEIVSDKRKYMNLLLLADEQEDMIYKYLDTGTMYVLDDKGVKVECVVTDKGNGILEIKNIATLADYQGNGYGRTLIQFIENKYRNTFQILQVGTGDSPLTIPFYQKCGFTESHRIKNFFTDNYNHPIIECGVLLTDMVYLRKKL